MLIGQRIRALRKEKNISIDELAEKLGKNRATIYRYEKGDIENLPLDILEPLAEALNTTPGYIMGWDNRSLVGTCIKDGEKESIYFAVNDKNVKHVELWHDIFGIDAFTDEEFNKLIEYGKFLKSLRKGE
ncbi:MAG: helix-turn-helix domain-containing protein [Anaeroplasma sp.]